MARPKKWDIVRKERLFEVAREHLDELTSTEYEITKDSHVIRNIHEAFGELDCDASSVLYQLAEMKFVSQKHTSLRTGIFFRQSDNIRIDNYKVGPTYATPSDAEIKEIIDSIPGHFGAGCKDVIDLCSRLSSSGHRTARNFQKILYDCGIAKAAPDGKLRLDSKYDAFSALPVKSLVAAREAPREILDRITEQRILAGHFYVATGHPLPAIIRSTDGTGYGKSYSVFDQFLNNARCAEPDLRHRNLLFITPQKAQIDIDRKLVDGAERIGVPFLPILSREDLTNPDFNDWVGKESNRDKYHRWFKAGKKAADIGPDLARLEATLNQIDSTNNQLATVVDFVDQALLRKQLQSLAGRCLNLLKDAALAALNQNGNYTSIAKLRGGIGKLDPLRFEIVSRYFPLECALHEPCILLATTKKFDTQMPILGVGKAGQHVAKLADFYELIGGSRHEDGLVMSAAVALGDSDQRVFLREQLFIEDENNKFRQAKVAFTVVVDEEHEAYKILASDRKISLIDHASNIPHVLSTVCRVYKSIGGGNGLTGLDRPLYEVARDFFARVEALLASKCELSPGQTMASVIALFESNIGYVQIDKRDVEQVINVTRNVFSFTPKRFFNEGALKNIRLRGCDGNTYCQIYFGSREDGNATLYDLYQLLMALLAAASEIPSEDFLRMLGSEGDGSQNTSLRLFILRALKHRYEVKNLFDRSMDEDQIVNRFFTYFQPKTVFSIEPRKSVHFKDPRLNEFVYADFRMDLLRELPEVSLMRMAHNTRNAVYCLSATTGFQSIYNGNYNHNVLQHYGEQGADNLGFSVIRRGKQDIPILEGLRDARASIRSATFHPFPVEGMSITPDPVDPEVTRLLKVWANKLDPSLTMRRHRYQKREFMRQLEAIMLAAYDGKNTLILSLSGRIRTLFSKYLENCQYKCRVLKRRAKGENDIYDFMPFSNGVSLRLVFFHSDLAKRLNVRDFTALSSDMQRLVFIAPYSSAGTGLNYFVTYEGTGFREDFSRLVLVNSPLYSEVVQPETGLNSLDNWLTLMKFYADSKQVKFLKDFDVNLVTGENYAVLMREHEMSLFKNLMQALGRVERADSLLVSEIFICSDLLDVATMQFEQLGRAGNDVVLGSMSLLNHSLRNYCQGLARAHSFPSVAARASFEKDVEEREQRIEQFFMAFLRSEIQRARTNVPSSADLNEALRSIDSIFDPAKWMADLKKNPTVASSAYRSAIIDSFFIQRDSGCENVTFCVKKQRDALTDIIGGTTLYRPQRQVLPQFDKDIDDRQGEFWTRFWKLVDFQDEAFRSHVPLPAILPLLKGNVGEYLLDGLLMQIGQDALSLEAVFGKLSAPCYELFDRYVEVDNNLICIDAKNWASSFDQTALAQKTHAEAKRKMALISDLLGQRYDEIKFVYLNTRVECNPLNIMPEADGEGAYYLNLLKRESGYAAIKDKKFESTMSDRLVLNRRLTAMLTPTSKKP
ncbi:hypothetical protein [Duganella fentianensis]|uniref:hypothetical protein n=1 Tax=Duganella fentianensis TaxID=2692177 RepID=UPI0032B10B5B